MMTATEHDELWRGMVEKSFDPRQWYDRDDDSHGNKGRPKPAREPRETLMWVYIRSEPQLYTVGFYDPSGEWHPDSDHQSREEAVSRVHFLNGGQA